MNFLPRPNCRVAVSLGALALVLLVVDVDCVWAEFRAGAAVVDITPTTVPVLVNGGILSRSLSKVNVPLMARAVAWSDGTTNVVVVVVDSCMLPRPLLDKVKSTAAEQTGIAADHIMVSSTHTHTAPSCMGCLGTDADPTYVPFVQEKLVNVIAAAQEKMQPAEVGFGQTDASDFTALRRWIRRPDRVDDDPFGNPTVRANMHAAGNWEDVTGPSGPEDPTLSLLSFRSSTGRPIAVLANFSMHYFGDRDLSSDYYGRFCRAMEGEIHPDAKCVAIMSHGCSGDIWRRDYSLPPDQRNDKLTIDQYTQELVSAALNAYRHVEYQANPSVAMSERRMTINYRVPDKQRLAWAERIVEAMGDRRPKTREEVYAREQVILDARKETEIVVQAMRIGEFGIATTPCETYALTGLKIKAASPFEQTMVIELANGGDGYIPPPEQHLLGGYNTWPARSAGLDVMAEPRITEACIELLEKVAGRPRRAVTASRGPAAHAIANAGPFAWWRLDETAGPRAQDSSGHHRDAIYEPGIAFFLDGPLSEQFSAPDTTNRAAMFAGGRLRTRIDNLGQEYSISLWFWNGMPVEARGVTGWIVSRGPDHGLATYSEHLGIGGRDHHAGTLIWMRGDDPAGAVAGTTQIARWTWHHLLMVHDDDGLRVFLDGRPEMTVKSGSAKSPSCNDIFFGGRTDNRSNWEGRLDEIAIFDHAISVKQVFPSRTVREPSASQPKE